MDFKLKILNFKYLFFIFIGILLAIVSLYNINNNVKMIIGYIVERFSINTLLIDLDSGDSGRNLRHAIEYFHQTIGNREISFQTLFIGVDSNLNFVDNFYVFIFLKHGILIIGLFVIMGMCFIAKTLINRNTIGLYFVLATGVIALKGIFIINNFYMILVLFTINFWICYYPGSQIKRPLSRCLAGSLSLKPLLITFLEPQSGHLRPSSQRNSRTVS